MSNVAWSNFQATGLNPASPHCVQTRLWMNHLRESIVEQTTLVARVTEKDSCYDPGGHLKKCRSPGQEKCRKSASESAGSKRGAEGSAEKSALGPVSYATLHRRGARSTFFGTFLGTPFRTGTFRSTFSALFLAGASALL